MLIIIIIVRRCLSQEIEGLQALTTKIHNDNAINVSVAL